MDCQRSQCRKRRDPAYSVGWMHGKQSHTGKQSGNSGRAAVCGACKPGIARHHERRCAEHGARKPGIARHHSEHPACWRGPDAQRDRCMMPVAQSWAEIVIPVIAIVSALLLMERRLARLEERVEFIVRRLFRPEELD